MSTKNSYKLTNKNNFIYKLIYEFDHFVCNKPGSLTAVEVFPVLKQNKYPKVNNGHIHKV